jgi:hypothetical protein
VFQDNFRNYVWNPLAGGGKGEFALLDVCEKIKINILCATKLATENYYCNFIGASPAPHSLFFLDKKK